MNKLIMIVDDNPETLKFLRIVFEPRGYDVLAAGDGDSALKTLADTTPDLFILDVMMPGINGIELCREIRALPAHDSTPVLFLSAWSDGDVVEQTFAAGANDYLVKPVHPLELEAKVNSMLAAVNGKAA